MIRNGPHPTLGSCLGSAAPVAAFLTALVISAPLSSRAAPTKGDISGGDVLLVTVSAGSIADAYRMLAGQGEWRTPSETQFAKIEVRFKSPLSLSRVEVATCSGPIDEGADIHVEFDRYYRFVEGGKSERVFPLSDDGKAVSLRSFVLNFRRNTGACLKSVRVFNGSEAIPLRVPSVVGAEDAQTPLALFDSRLDSSWTAGTTLAEIQLAEETQVSGLRIWNGDQRSQALFAQNGRAQSLVVSGENGFTETIALADKAGPQDILFKHGFKGRKLKLEPVAAAGAKGKAATLSEIQILGPTRAIVPDLSARFAALVAARRAAFESAKLAKVIDRSLVLRSENERWVVRVRSDGTFFMRGRSSSLNEAGVFSFLGHFDVKEASSKNVRLIVSGFRAPSHLELDGAVCLRGCAGDNGAITSFIQDQISLGRAKDGGVFVRDEGPRRSPGLGFDPLKMTISSGDD